MVCTQSTDLRHFTVFAEVIGLYGLITALILKYVAFQDMARCVRLICSIPSSTAAGEAQCFT